MSSGYNGTSGYSGNALSARRAFRLAQYGEYDSNKNTVASIVHAHGVDGATRLEVSALFDEDEPLHEHQRCSPVFTRLLIEGRIVRLFEERAGHAVHVSPEFVNDRDIDPYEPNGLHFTDEQKRVASAAAARLAGVVRSADQDLLLDVLKMVARSG